MMEISENYVRMNKGTLERAYGHEYTAVIGEVIVRHNARALPAEMDKRFRGRFIFIGQLEDIINQKETIIFRG